MHQIEGIQGNLVNDWCWIKGTYTKLPEENQQELGKLDHHCDPRNPDEKCWHHDYYQWVAIVLIIQAGCFYVPRYVIKWNSR